MGSDRDRFKLFDPAPREGVTSWAVYDAEARGVIAFVPAKAQAMLIVDVLNRAFTVSECKRCHVCKEHRL